jgi:uracil-DNA glycosylase
MQGVLLLNATLTVADGRPGSHQGRGWERFTDAVIQTISDRKEHVVFLLWGNFARSKAKLINEEKHYILEAPHPSPLSAHAGFFGCKHFSKANHYLEKHGLTPIDW